MKVESCQDFKQGCCGCCVNTHWSEQRIADFLSANTVAVDALIRRRGHELRVRDLIQIHLRRGGWRDYLFAFFLVPFTFGLSAVLWNKRYGSCCFAGWLNQEEQRVGCLIHPARLGGADLRKHAFPMVPTLSCDREMRCPMLDDPTPRQMTLGWFELSRMGAKRLKRGVAGSSRG
ncbi:MAG: hypothetical protein PHO37_12295 [Kiritimatiellae bacterium]|nr:hypothetical protein [Kiritimatiellia bacterium]